MSRFVKVVAACACAVLLPAMVYAQASITGVVKDSSGAVLPGVTVEAASPALIEKVRTRTRTNVGFDIYNVLNANPALTYNPAYSAATAWPRPTAVLQPRFLKLSAQIDF